MTSLTTSSWYMMVASVTMVWLAYDTSRIRTDLRLWLYNPGGPPSWPLDKMWLFVCTVIYVNPQVALGLSACLLLCTVWTRTTML